jgi:alpha-beta hydrolase superfamily lysophospholipase
VLCAPLGYEYMSAYRTWRILAEQLAALGFDVIRFDYDATGNSEGSHDDPDRVAAWIESISDAMVEARRVAGSPRLALVGLRTGTLLALEAAAAQGGVDRVVLWSPFASGRACVRETMMFAKLSQQDHAHEDDGPDGSMNVAGHVLSAQTVHELQRWTLDRVRSIPARDVLVVDRDDRATDAAVDEHLRKLGSCVLRVRPAGTAAMLAPPQRSTVPVDALHAITSWFDTWRVSQAAEAPCASRDPVASRREETPARAYRDEPVRFGRENALFGVLTTPVEDERTAPAVILFNTGLEYHVGPNRMYVPLAREWASCGHPVLRFDIGGIGDSESPSPEEENAAYPTHMLDDARAAVELMLERVGRRPLIAIGMCSGGWLAYRAACEHLPVAGIVAVNAPLYLLEGAGGTRWLTDLDELQRYQDSLRDPAKWAKALRGRTSYRAFARLAATSLRQSVATHVGSVVSGSRLSGLAGDLDRIAARRIRSLFVFSSGDRGLDYFELNGAPALRRRRVARHIRRVAIDGAGHTFRPIAAQERLRALLTAFVRGFDDRSW